MKKGGRASSPFFSKFRIWDLRGGGGLEAETTLLIQQPFLCLDGWVGRRMGLGLDGRQDRKGKFKSQVGLFNTGNWKIYWFVVQPFLIAASKTTNERHYDSMHCGNGQNGKICTYGWAFLQMEQKQNRSCWHTQTWFLYKLLYPFCAIMGGNSWQQKKLEKVLTVIWQKNLHFFFFFFFESE